MAIILFKSHARHRPSSRTHNQAGFAVAVIFATLLAIALILGYLSLSSQNALQSGGNAEAKGSAIGLQQGAMKLKNGMDRFVMSGTVADSTIYAYKAMDTNASCVGEACLWNRPQNLFGPLGTASIPTFDVNAYETSAVTCTPDDLAGESASLSGGKCVFYLTKISSTSNFYNNTTVTTTDAQNFIVFYTAPIKTPVCRQLNTVLWKSNLDDAIPSISAWSSPQKLGVPTTVGGIVGLVNQNTVAADNGSAVSGNTPFPTYSGAIRNEGCLNDDSATNPTNFYIKSLRQLN